MRLIANGFVADLPEGWEDRSMITLVGRPEGTGFAPNVVVMRQRVAPQTSIEAYAREQRAATEAEIPGLEIIDERTATVGGAPAFQRLQRFSAHGLQLQQAQTYVLGDGLVFVLTCTATLEQFNHHIAHFRQVVDSFRLFNPETATL
ncbi:MAG TPA: DcrB-related protein [Pyrinomonadaceae bacterium]|jgi:hypothetical protein